MRYARSGYIRGQQLAWSSSSLRSISPALCLYCKRSAKIVSNLRALLIFLPYLPAGRLRRLLETVPLRE